MLPFGKFKCNPGYNMSIQTDYFPLGIAKGEAFCNRVSERKQLVNNIHKNKHSIVISTRRYGKSSLVLYSLEESNIYYERVDLFVAVSIKTIQDQIMRGVKNLINQVSTAPEQAIGFIKNYIQGLKSKWIVGTDGINIELIPEENGEPGIIIMEALQMLENFLNKKKKKAIFFIDEFQEVGVLANNSGIEGAIRQVAQESENLCFIFSGSNRHILASMFDDKSSPLYMLCDRVIIDRISENDYIAYLNKIAIRTWKKNLEEPVISEIFRLTERHSYYMNVLCDKIWSHCTDTMHTIHTMPTVGIVQSKWHDYVLQEESKVAKELSSLNISQKKIMITIAQGVVFNLTSKDILRKFNLTSAAIIKSIRLLEEKDYLKKNKNGEYFIVDPLIKSSLQLFYPKL